MSPHFSIHSLFRETRCRLWKLAHIACCLACLLAACDSRERAERDALSKQQSEQIARLTESLQSKEDAVRKENEARPAVSGFAYLTRTSADSIVLRDLEVVLFQPSVDALWHETVKDESTYQSQSEGNDTGSNIVKALFEFDMSLFTMKLTRSHIVGTTRTDTDGRFAIPPAPAGEYLIYAYLKTPLSSVGWLGRIAVKDGETTQFNLTNSSARVILNGSF
jgi:hypothetical protein